MKYKIYEAKGSPRPNTTYSNSVLLHFIELNNIKNYCLIIPKELLDQISYFINSVFNVNSESDLHTKGSKFSIKSKGYYGSDSFEYFKSGNYIGKEIKISNYKRNLYVIL